MTGDNRAANARAEVVAARDALRVAAAALGLGIRRDAMSRAYYAVFHAARALLLLEGLEPKTHARVGRMVGAHLVRTGKLDAHSGLVVTRLQAYRQASDYSYVFEIDEVEAKAEIAAAEVFVEQAAKTVAGSVL